MKKKDIYNEEYKKKKDELRTSLISHKVRKIVLELYDHKAYQEYQDNEEDEKYSKAKEICVKDAEELIKDFEESVLYINSIDMENKYSWGAFWFGVLQSIVGSILVFFVLGFIAIILYGSRQDFGNLLNDALNDESKQLTEPREAEQVKQDGG